MALEVIGAGFGRTGTHALKLALERLGFGPCYHMAEVIQRPDRAVAWDEAAAGRAVDWNAVFAGYRSTTDWPGCDYWRDYVARWPDAKVVLTVRDPDTWYRSARATIFNSDINPTLATDTPLGRTMRAILSRHFGGRSDDREACLAAFARHNADVVHSVPPRRMLTYEISEGWAPLCRFLGVGIPDEPFPRSNSTEEFQSRAAAMRAATPEMPAH